MPKDVSINFSLLKAARRAPVIMAQFVNKVADITVDNTRTGFIAGVDVNDHPYQPKKSGAPSRLFKSGTMNEGVHVSKRAGASQAVKTAEITSGARSKDYAAVHNEGIGSMPQREWFPSKILKRSEKDIRAEILVTERKLVASVK